MMIEITKWMELLRNKLQGWWIALINMLPNFIVAILVLTFFFFVGRLIRRVVYKVSIRMSGKTSVSVLFSAIVYLVFVFIGIFIALDILQLDKAVSSLLAGAGIIGLALGFAFQDLTANFISGVFIAFRKPFEVGETVETNGFIGNIEEIHLRTTTIRTFQGLHLMIPNKEIFQKPMINHSRTDERRIEIEFSLSLENDLEVAQRVAIEAIQKLPYLHKEKAIEFYFTGFHENAIRVAIWFWINNHLPPGFMAARHEAIFNVMQAYNDSNISILIPIAFEGNKLLKDPVSKK